MYKHLIVSASVLAALALAGCANHAPQAPVATAKRAPIHAVAKQATPTAPAWPPTKAEAEYEAGIDAVLAYDMNDATTSTPDGIFTWALNGAPVGTIVTVTAGRVVRVEDGLSIEAQCKWFQKDYNWNVSACSVPRVVLVVTPCIRSECPRSNGALVAVVPSKDAPKLGDVVTVLRGPGAGMVRVINDGFRVDDPVWVRVHAKDGAEDGAGSVE